MKLKLKPALASIRSMFKITFFAFKCTLKKKHRLPKDGRFIESLVLLDEKKRTYLYRLKLLDQVR